MLHEASEAVKEFMVEKKQPLDQRLTPMTKPGGSVKGVLGDWPHLYTAIENLRHASKRALRVYEVQEAHSIHNYQAEHSNAGRGGFHSSTLSQEPPDPRFLKFSLVAEEAGVEFLTALMNGDELGLFDAIIDAIYVLVGTGLTYDLPLAAGFAEVHRSNMSKASTGQARIKDKGANYTPPDLARILKEHRNGNL